MRMVNQIHKTGAVEELRRGPLSRDRAEGLRVAWGGRFLMLQVIAGAPDMVGHALQPAQSIQRGHGIVRTMSAGGGVVKDAQALVLAQLSHAQRITFLGNQPVGWRLAGQALARQANEFAALTYCRLQRGMRDGALFVRRQSEAGLQPRQMIEGMQLRYPQP